MAWSRALFWRRRGKVWSVPTPPPGQNAAAPIADQPRGSTRLWKIFEHLLGRFRDPGAGATVARVQSLRLPDPAPGVLPAGIKHGAMAMDQQIQALYDVGYGWSGSGFMGYALLADLCQIPEFRIPCEIIAEKMTSRWGRVVSSGEDDKTDLIKKIESEFERLGVQEAFRWAFEKDLQMGRSQIWVDLGVDYGDELLKPLDAKIKVAKGSMKGLRLIEPIWTYPNIYNSSDPLNPDFYRPSTWFVMGKEVHSSRFLNFCSRPMPDLLKPAYMFGGMSLIQMMWLCVENWLQTRQCVSNIINSFTTFALAVDLSQATTVGDANNLIARATVFNEARSNMGLFIYDKSKEDFKNISAPLSSLDKLQAQSQEHMAAIAGVPLIVLFGISPTGLNATAEPELLVFESKIAGLQERVGTPNIRKLIEIVQMNLVGQIDPDIGWQWNPLRDLDAKGLADLQKSNAEVDCAYIDHGVIDPVEVRSRLALDDNSGYDGLAAEDVPAETQDPADEPDPRSPDQDEAGAAPDAPDAPDAHLPKVPRKKKDPGGAADAAPFREGDHPRDSDGKFGSGSGGGGSASSLDAEQSRAIKAYTAEGYRAIQAHLRGGKAASPEVAEQISQLKSLIGSHRTTADTTVFRGVGSLAVEQLLGPERKAKKGQVLTDNGFTSTSHSEGVAARFRDVSPKNIMMVVKIPKGSAAMDISKYSDDPGEKETLVNCGSRYKVVKYDQKSRRLEVELLPHSDKPNGDMAIDAKTAPPTEDEGSRFVYETAAGLKMLPSTDPDAETFDLS